MSYLRTRGEHINQTDEKVEVGTVATSEQSIASIGWLVNQLSHISAVLHKVLHHVTLVTLQR